MMMSRNGCSGGADEYAASRVPPGTVRESPPELLAVRGSFEEASDATIASLREHGGAVWDGCISAEALAEAREVRPLPPAVSGGPKTPLLPLSATPAFWPHSRHVHFSPISPYRACIGPRRCHGRLPGGL